MRDIDKTKEQLVNELAETRQKIGELEALKDKRKQAEALYSTLANNSPVGVYIVQDKKFILPNPAFQRATGFAKDELLGRDPSTIVHPEDRESVRQNAVQMLKGKRLEPYEFRVITKSGETKWALERATSIVYQGRRATLGNFMDITERRETERKLQESEERWHSLVTNAPNIIMLVDGDSAIQFINHAVSGMDPENVIGKSIYDYIQPEYHDTVRKAMNTVFETGNPGSYEIEGVGPDGSASWYETQIGPIKHNGQVVAVVQVISDITERKTIEAVRMRADLKAQISNRLSIIGQMSSGIAHEINNPLTGVIGFAHLLLQKDIPEDIRKDLEIIHDGAQRVASIVSRLLIFARQQKRAPEGLNINETITSTVAIRAYEMETNNIDVTMQLAPDLLVTVADGGQLQQVFLNIILNAEMEMKLAHGKGSLLIRTETIDNTIRISFKDDGPGISAENMERIFDPFFTTREVGKGAGLGLSICQGIIAEHGGRIWAESELSKGATLIVELPIVRETGQPKLGAPATDKTKDEAKVKILVVDDELIVIEFLQELLTEAGYYVDSVDNAAGALEKLENNRYSVILLDIKMRGMSGIELYEHLQNTAQSLAERVAFITGDVIGEDVWKFLRKVKVPYLTKPFDQKQLIEEINRISSKVVGSV